MMGSSHALSGAVAWLGLCAAAEPVAGLQPDPVTVVAGSAVAAGAALWPDIDHPSSTVARSLGPLTRAAARIISYVSDKVRDNTCGCCATSGTHGHRTLTHTAVFAIATGVGLSLAGSHLGASMAAWVVGLLTGVAVLGLRSGKGAWTAAVLLGGSAGAAVWQFGGGTDWWWLGIPAGLGTLIHTAGDGLTHHGVPLWWPLRIRGCRWQRVGTPRPLRFRTGGPAEQLVVAAMLAGGIAAAAALWGADLVGVFAGRS